MVSTSMKLLDHHDPSDLASHVDSKRAFCKRKLRGLALLLTITQGTAFTTAIFVTSLQVQQKWQKALRPRVGASALVQIGAVRHASVIRLPPPASHQQQHFLQAPTSAAYSTTAVPSTTPFAKLVIGVPRE